MTDDLRRLDDATTTVTRFFGSNILPLSLSSSSSLPYHTKHVTSLLNSFFAHRRVVVDGRTPEDVSEGILKDIVEKSKGKGRENIGVITIVGFSGVGKGKRPKQEHSEAMTLIFFSSVSCHLSANSSLTGTTVAKLKSSLVSLRSDTNPDLVLCWSNGNIFRSLTVLTSLYMQSKNLENVEEVISGEGSEVRGCEISQHTNLLWNLSL